MTSTREDPDEIFGRNLWEKIQERYDNDEVSEYEDSDVL